VTSNLNLYLLDSGSSTSFILEVVDSTLQPIQNALIYTLRYYPGTNTYETVQMAVTDANGTSVGYFESETADYKFIIVRNGVPVLETETKKVVIATYAMAAEALDIKTLTTLIMATPKTDIEQSVGRILREKHSAPIVVDIVDSHDLFKNQWRKRKTFYKKENYKIIYTISTNYSTDYSTWTSIYTPNPNGAKECKSKKTKNVISKKSNSSSDKSITNDSDTEDENEEPEPTSKSDKYMCEVCYLKIK
jgi:hypothetical protein